MKYLLLLLTLSSPALAKTVHLYNHSNTPIFMAARAWTELSYGTMPASPHPVWGYREGGWDYVAPGDKQTYHYAQNICVAVRTDGRDYVLSHVQEFPAPTCHIYEMWVQPIPFHVDIAKVGENKYQVLSYSSGGVEQPASGFLAEADLNTFLATHGYTPFKCIYTDQEFVQLNLP